jgi:RNA polymerase sigma-70 factor, ECF subfamily
VEWLATNDCGKRSRDKSSNVKYIMEATSQWPTTSNGLLDVLRDSPSPATWERFWSLYSPVLHRFCCQRGLQDSDAHDVVQQVMIAVSQRMGTFQYVRDRGRFRSWLATIALRILWKKKTRDGQHALQLLDAKQLDQLPAHPLAVVADLNSAVSDVALENIQPEFSPEVWEAFTRVWVRDESPREVAEQMARAPHWVYKAKFTVLSRLKAEVQGILDDFPGFDNV